MAVYVDNAKIRYGRMIMFHLVADTLDELFQMVDKIGVDRKWFQAKASFPHFDICKSKKELALQNGAIEVDNRRLVAVMQEFRAKHTVGK